MYLVVLLYECFGGLSWLLYGDSSNLIDEKYHVLIMGVIEGFLFMYRY